MEERQVVLRFLVPANKQAAKAVHPRMRWLDDPASRAEPGFPVDGFDLFSSRANVRRELECLQDLLDLWVVAALLPAPPLRLLQQFGHGPCDDPALEGGAHQLHVLPIGAFY